MREVDGAVEFVWWFGVVEDIDDPLEVGRCRVRVFGYHTSDKTALPIDKLPWATVVFPSTSASLSGIGATPGLLTGSHVFGFFLDGRDAQKPVILGSVAGIPEELANPAEGFSDPKGIFPLRQSVNGLSTVKESDINRLARGFKTDETYLKGRKDKTDKDFPIAFGDTKSEPESPHGAKYGFNQVRASVSGHIEEFDDTPTKERIIQYHNSGTFTEVANGWKDDPRGTRVVRVVGNNYEVIHKDNTVHIRGACNVTIDGEARILCLDKAFLQVEDDAEVSVNGDANLNIADNLTMKVGGDVNAKATGKFNVTAAEVNLHTTGGGRVNISQNMVGLNSVTVGAEPKEVTLEKPEVKEQTLNAEQGGGIASTQTPPTPLDQAAAEISEYFGLGLNEDFDEQNDISEEMHKTLIERALEQADGKDNRPDKADPKVKKQIQKDLDDSLNFMTTRSETTVTYGGDPQKLGRMSFLQARIAALSGKAQLTKRQEFELEQAEKELFKLQGIGEEGDDAAL